MRTLNDRNAKATAHATNVHGFYVGQYGDFEGLDHRGVLKIKGEIRRLWQEGPNVFASVRCDEVLDKHFGLTRYYGADVTQRLQVAGPKVDLLYARRVRSTVA